MGCRPRRPLAHCRSPQQPEAKDRWRGAVPRQVYRHPVTQALSLPYFVQCGEIGKKKAAACVTVTQGIVKKGIFLCIPTPPAA